MTLALQSTDTDQAITHSRLFVGWVRHRRYKPKSHTLHYRVFMTYLDLDEIDTVFASSRLWSNEKANWMSFRRNDYFKGKEPDLKRSVIRHISENSLIKADHIHRVTMLTNLRTLGYAMNPVTFYYAFDHNDNLLAIMPEITNTPWEERYQYILTTRSEFGGTPPSVLKSKSLRYRLQKAFHVSPFNPMSVDYDWRFSVPNDGKNVIHLINNEAGETVFDATMSLEPVAISAKNVRKALIHFPWMTVKIALGIYVNALKLWLKGVPFYSHPKKSNKENNL